MHGKYGKKWMILGKISNDGTFWNEGFNPLVNKLNLFH